MVLCGSISLSQVYTKSWFKKGQSELAKKIEGTINNMLYMFLYTMDQLRWLNTKFWKH